MVVVGDGRKRVKGEGVGGGGGGEVTGEPEERGTPTRYVINFRGPGVVCYRRARAHLTTISA